MTFYERLKELLEQHSMTAKDLSNCVGITGASITGWKNGSIPNADVVIKIAEYFNTSVEYLITGTEKELKPEIKELAIRIDALPLEYQKIVKDLVSSFENILSTK